MCVCVRVCACADHPKSAVLMTKTLDPTSSYKADAKSDNSLSNNSFYMKANRVYKPENFDGKLQESTASSQIGQYHIIGEEQQLYEEIPEESEEKPEGKSKEMPDEENDQHLYDLPIGEDKLKKDMKSSQKHENSKDNADDILYAEAEDPEDEEDAEEDTIRSDGTDGEDSQDTAPKIVPNVIPQYAQVNKSEKGREGTAEACKEGEKFHLVDDDESNGKLAWLYDLKSADKKIQEIYQDSKMQSSEKEKACIYSMVCGYTNPTCSQLAALCLF